MASKKTTLREKAASRVRNIKQRSITVPTALLSGLVVLVVGVGVGANTQVWDGGLKLLGIKPNVPTIDLSSVESTYEKLAANYDGTIDQAKLIDGANHGLVNAIGDPYTVYFSKSEADEFDSALDGSFSGIGAELSIKNDILTVASVLDSSPAKTTGVQAGDMIVGVDDKSTQGWSVDKAVSAIRGKSGTQVKLSIVRGDTPQEITVTRAALTDPSVKSEVIDGIGVIRISRFGETETATLARKAAADFKQQGVKGVILDLRGNGGGYVEAAQNIANIWLDNKTIVSEKTNGVTTQTLKSSNIALLNGVPTIVLIDGGSASASEIVAGALRDNGAATLYGTKSFGKGVVQNIFDLSAGNELKVTVARWYTPNGKNIDKTGITPDTVLAPTDDQINAGEDIVKAAALAKLNG